MNPRGGMPSRGARDPSAESSVNVGDGHRLLAALASRARRLGSRDPEAASQEALKRSLENVNSRSAMEFYFADAAPGPAPEWQFDHLLAWLHAVLRNVIREERGRVGYWREIDSMDHPNLQDTSPDPLQTLMRKEVAECFGECFEKLDRGQRAVLRMRVRGLSYREIADSLGVNENTVATWISRGTRMLGRLLKTRIGDGRGRPARWGR